MTDPDVPLLCPECGATPTVKHGKWNCWKCLVGGVLLADGYCAVSWRHLGSVV